VDAITVDPATERLLADVAGYRHRWQVTGPSPLGDGARDVDQANERALLTLAIDGITADPSDVTQPAPTVAGWAEQLQLLLDDTLGW
jgi:hypothetical protein